MRLIQSGSARNGKRRHVDTAGHQNLPLLPAAGHQFLLWCSLSFFIAPFLPFKARYRFINVYWCRCALWLSKVFLGIRYEVKGAENVPTQPCVIQSNHQSTWETFFLSAYFEPLEPGAQARIALCAVLRLGHGHAATDRHRSRQPESRTQACGEERR